MPQSFRPAVWSLARLSFDVSGGADAGYAEGMRDLASDLAPLLSELYAALAHAADEAQAALGQDGDAAQSTDWPAYDADRTRASELMGETAPCRIERLATFRLFCCSIERLFSSRLGRIKCHFDH